MLDRLVDKPDAAYAVSDGDEDIVMYEATNRKTRSAPKDIEDEAVSVAPKMQSLAPKGRKPRWWYCTSDEIRELHGQLSNKYKASLEDIKTMKAERTQERKDHRLEIQQWKTRYNEVLNRMKNMEDEMRIEKSQMRQSMQQSKADEDEMRRTFARAEQELLKKNKSDTYPLLPDNVIREKFAELLVRCKDWVKDWHTDDKACWTAKLRDMLMQCEVDRDSGHHGKIVNELVAKGPPSARLLGQAWLTRNVIDHLLSKPFILFSRLTGQLADGVLLDIYTLMCRSDTKKACSWRAESVRVLRDSIDLHYSDHSSERCEKVLKFASTRAGETIQKMSRHLLREESNLNSSKREEELASIYYDAAVLWFDIWSHKSLIELVDRNNLVKSRFAIRSDLYEPHITMGLDADDTTCDGQVIDMVLIPGIRVFGNASGDNFECSKIWSKAVVWMLKESAGDDTQRSTGTIMSSGLGVKRTADIAIHNNDKRTKTQNSKHDPRIRQSSDLPQDRDLRTTQQYMPGAAFDSVETPTQSSDQKNKLFGDSINEREGHSMQKRQEKTGHLGSNPKQQSSDLGILIRSDTTGDDEVLDGDKRSWQSSNETKEDDGTGSKFESSLKK